MAHRHPREDQTYWEAVKAWATTAVSDGCTLVRDWYVECCYEHDLHWSTGQRLDGTPIGLFEANREFRWCIESRSPVRWFSPLAWTRWIGVSANAIRKTVL